MCEDDLIWEANVLSMNKRQQRQFPTTPSVGMEKCPHERVGMCVEGFFRGFDAAKRFTGMQLADTAPAIPPDILHMLVAVCVCVWEAFNWWTKTIDAVYRPSVDRSIQISCTFFLIFQILAFILLDWLDHSSLPNDVHLIVQDIFTHSFFPSILVSLRVTSSRCFFFSVVLFPHSKSRIKESTIYFRLRESRSCCSVPVRLLDINISEGLADNGDGKAILSQLSFVRSCSVFIPVRRMFSRFVREWRIFVSVSTSCSGRLHQKNPFITFASFVFFSPLFSTRSSFFSPLVFVADTFPASSYDQFLVAFWPFGRQSVVARLVECFHLALQCHRPLRLKHEKSNFIILTVSCIIVRVLDYVEKIPFSCASIAHEGFRSCWSITLSSFSPPSFVVSWLHWSLVEVVWTLELRRTSSIEKWRNSANKLLVGLHLFLVSVGPKCASHFVIDLIDPFLVWQHFPTEISTLYFIIRKKKRVPLSVDDLRRSFKGFTILTFFFQKHSSLDRPFFAPHPSRTWAPVCLGK